MKILITGACGFVGSTLAVSLLEAMPGTELYGMDNWGSILSSRQSVSLVALSRLIRTAGDKVAAETDQEFGTAVQSVLALNLSKLVDLATTLGAWEPNIPTVQHVFGRQAIAKYIGEGNPHTNQNRPAWAMPGVEWPG